MRPTPRCVLLFAAGIGAALLPAAVHPRLWTVWLAYVAVALFLCGLDALLALPARRLDAAVEAPETLFIGDADPLRVVLRAPPGRAAAVDVLCDLGARLEPQPLRRVALPDGGEATLEVPLSPKRRGTARVVAVWLRWAGPFGLVRRQVRRHVGLDVPVVPNVRAVRRAALRFFSAREYRAGLKVERYVGDGSEFESLREYRPGLDHRSMNWKASARHRTLLCTEYRAERNHQVVVAVDTGHLMAEPLEGVPRLDRAINAGLLLSYVCLRTGDRVGFYTFDEKVRGYAEPDGGTRAFRRLQQLSAGIEYATAETNFTLGLTELSMRLRRRSLIVLLTEFVDTVTTELMIDNLQRLARRHLVLFVALRDPGLEAVADVRPGTLHDLYRAVVADDFVRERDLVLRRLQRLGVHGIDAAPGEVTTSLLNRYLDLKRRELF